MPQSSNIQIMDFFRSVFATYDTNNDGKIDAQELGSVLKSLGRACSEERLAEMIEEFDFDHDGQLDWTNGEFLMVVAATDVVDVNEIDDLVFSSAFRTFDQVIR